jgi:RNA polymerase sigma factor for flagellar operon FliA
MGETISIEEADRMVLEHQGWAESIARSVARAWNMDWRLDGLDGAAMEALIFCARRFDGSRGIPFRGYARKRIHEASTDAARKSRGWRRGLTGTQKAEQNAREVSAELFNVFPELRSGELPHMEDGGDGGGDGDTRAAVRQLLVGASIIAAKQASTAQPDDMLDFKRLVELMSTLEPVHQALMWKIYWEGESMRTVASDWGIDELNVIREHKVLLAYLLKGINTAKASPAPKVRPGLKTTALKLKKEKLPGNFSDLVAHKFKGIDATPKRPTASREGL